MILFTLFAGQLFLLAVFVVPSAGIAVAVAGRAAARASPLHRRWKLYSTLRVPLTCRACRSGLDSRPTSSGVFTNASPGAARVGGALWNPTCEVRHAGTHRP